MLFSGSRIRFQTNPPCSIRMGGNKKTKKTGQDEPIKKSNNKGYRLDNLVRTNILSLKNPTICFFSQVSSIQSLSRTDWRKQSQFLIISLIILILTAVNQFRTRSELERYIVGYILWET